MNGKSTRAQRPALAKLNAKAVPEEWSMLVALLQREAHPNISRFQVTGAGGSPAGLGLDKTAGGAAASTVAGGERGVAGPGGGSAGTPSHCGLGAPRSNWAGFSAALALLVAGSGSPSRPFWRHSQQQRPCVSAAAHLARS